MVDKINRNNHFSGITNITYSLMRVVKPPCPVGFSTPVYAAILITEPALCSFIPDRIKTREKAALFKLTDSFEVIFSVRIIQCGVLSLDGNLKLQA